MSNKILYQFTVFTATFNRGHLLMNVYNGLKKQTFKDFEWIIVDDGSTDSTEKFVSAWIKENCIPIRYFKQENQGKQSAFNFGVQEAEGKFFLNIDSDDYCVDTALEKLIFYWQSIPETEQKEFSGIMSLCVDRNNQLIGDKFPKDIFDSSWIETFYVYNVKGDKWGFFKTEIFKKYPFPIINNEKFISEAIVFNRIGLQYKTRFINEKLLVVEYQKDGYSKSSLRLRMANPLGTLLYYKEFLSLPVNPAWKIRNFINYLRFSFHAKKNIFVQISCLAIVWLKIISPAIAPIAYYLYVMDNKKIKI